MLVVSIVQSRGRWGRPRSHLLYYTEINVYLFSSVKVFQRTSTGRSLCQTLLIGAGEAAPFTAQHSECNPSIWEARFTSDLCFCIREIVNFWFLCHQGRHVYEITSKIPTLIIHLHFISRWTAAEVSCCWCIYINVSTRRPVGPAGCLLIMLLWLISVAPLHCLFVSAQLQYFNHLTLQDRQDVAKSPQSLIFTHSLIMRTSAVFLSFGRSQTTGISLPPTSRMNHLVFKKFLGINSETARLETAGYSSMPLCLCSHSIFLFTHKHHHRCSIIPVSSHLNQTSLMWWLPCVAFTARIRQIFLENHKSDSSICSYVWSAYIQECKVI